MRFLLQPNCLNSFHYKDFICSLADWQLFLCILYLQINNRNKRYIIFLCESNLKTMRGKKKKKLENTPKIRNKKHAVIEEYNHEWVFIVLDRTKMECKTDLNLRTELQAKWQNFLHDRWKIFLGKTIKILSS